MGPTADDDCLFCRMVTGDVPADVVHETDSVLAFRDINPQAPVHVLIIPRSHYPTAADLAHAEPSTAAEMLTVAGTVAEHEGLDEGYRLVFNTGASANQVVFHAHLHVLGGRQLTWPPG